MKRTIESGGTERSQERKMGNQKKEEKKWRSEGQGRKLEDQGGNGRKDRLKGRKESTEKEGKGWMGKGNRWAMKEKKIKLLKRELLEKMWETRKDGREDEKWGDKEEGKGGWRR